MGEAAEAARDGYEYGAGLAWDGTARVERSEDVSWGRHSWTRRGRAERQVGTRRRGTLGQDGSRTLRRVARAWRCSRTLCRVERTWRCSRTLRRAPRTQRHIRLDLRRCGRAVLQIEWTWRHGRRSRTQRGAPRTRRHGRRSQIQREVERTRRHGRRSRTQRGAPRTPRLSRLSLRRCGRAVREVERAWRRSRAVR